MLVGRMNKEPMDVRRCTVDFTQWLDAGETITAFTDPAITNLLLVPPDNPWGFLPGFAPPSPLPVDADPLIVGSSFLISGNEVQLFFKNGTPGNTYQAQFVATGSSTRQQTIELQITVTGAANAIVQ